MSRASIVAARSITGVSHSEDGIECQDFSDTLIAGEYCALIVADGAGSASMAAIGARCVVEKAKEYLSATLSGHVSSSSHLAGLLSDTLAAARASILQLADEHSEPLRNFATTLSVLIRSDDECFFSSVGDSSAVLVFPDGRTQLVSEPASGEPVNFTSFITSDRFPDNVFTAHSKGFTVSAFLQTDGLQWATLNCGRPFQDFYQYFVESAEILSAYPQELAEEALRQFIERSLLDPNLRSKCTDDLTLAMCWCSEFDNSMMLVPEHVSGGDEAQ